MKYSRSSLLLLLLFWPFTALVLLCDSQVVAQFSDNGQLWSNLLAPVFLLLLMTRLSPQRQLTVALFVPLSALGETIFSLVFGLYEYRFHAVPIYVPFGHSILMSVGLMLSDTQFVQQNLRRVQIGLLAFHGALILGALVFFGDTLSTLWAVIFILLLKKRIATPFYLILGVLVLYVEILGTRWGVWVWGAEPFGIFRTVNPPVGAFTCYVIGDLLAMKIALHLQTRWKLRQEKRLQTSDSPTSA